MSFLPARVDREQPPAGTASGAARCVDSRPTACLHEHNVRGSWIAALSLTSDTRASKLVRKSIRRMMPYQQSTISTESVTLTMLSPMCRCAASGAVAEQIGAVLQHDG